MTKTTESIDTKTTESIDDLCQVYIDWNKANGLNLGSADEHWFDADLTEKQREWIREFSRRWDAAAEREQKN